MKQLTFRRRPARLVWLAAAVLLALAGALLAADSRAAEPDASSGQRLLTVYDRGTERVFLTSAATVGEALDRAGIDISPTDTVEPAPSEELVASDYNVNIYRSRPVIVVDGPSRRTIMTSHQTPEQIAESAGAPLYPEDETELGMPRDMLATGAGLELVIDRATPLELVLYGQAAEVRTQAATVGEMLADKNITLGPNDQLSVAADQPVKAGMRVELWRNGKQTITEEKEVAFSVEQIQDADREVGYREVKTPGQPGKRTVTYEVEMKNGQEISRREIASVVTKQPTPQVEVIGVKPKNVFSGGLGEAMASLRQCESGGNYANKNNPTYRGAYQFGYSTWGNRGGYYDPAEAPPSLQDQAALELYQRRGWSPWPACAQSLGLQDIYR